MEYKNISFNKENENIWLLTLENKILNAETREELNDCLCRINPTITGKPKVLIITGKDKFFCVGADLSEIKELAENFDEVKIKEFLKSGRNIMFNILGLPIITIAAINGYALGGGLELALSCDFRICASNADARDSIVPGDFLGLPEATLGFPPGWLGTVLLPRIINPVKAKKLILTGQKVAPYKALELGLIDDIANLGFLIPHAQFFASQFLENEYEVVRILKRNFQMKHCRGFNDSSFAQEAEREKEDFIECFRKGFAKIGIEKFFASRKKK